MKSLEELCRQVGAARIEFIGSTGGLTARQYLFKPSDDEWSVADNAEHMVWAEQGGINGMWKTLESVKAGQPLWVGEAVHHGLSIEDIIEKTWQPKEKVPEVAKPRWGGPLEFWIQSLQGCQPLLESLVKALHGHDPEKVIYPHAISGPLNVIQRFEFLRFHLSRHKKQVERLKAHPQFPEN